MDVQPMASMGVKSEPSGINSSRSRSQRPGTAVSISAVFFVLIAGAVGLQIAGRRDPQGHSARLVLMSDTHMTGPEYTLGVENGIIDNDSITRTQMRMFTAINALNNLLGLSPTPMLALFGGDVVHNGIYTLDEPGWGFNTTGLDKLFAMPVNGYTIASTLMNQLEIPKLYAWGNHDNVMRCGQPERSMPRDLTRQIYERYLNAQPYDYRDVGSWRVISLNSMLGVTWDPDSPRCWDRLSSYGEEQLRWLDGLLAAGKPTVLLLHFPPVTAAYNETSSEEHRDLATVLGRHPNAKLMLSGHFHKGMDWGDVHGIPSFTTPGLRYNAQNFFVLDLFEDGTFDLPDWGKNRGHARCSDFWVYNASHPGGVFEARQRLRDPGNCGYPGALPEEEAAFPPLPVVNSTDQLPSQDDFNPEGGCRFEFAKKHFGACARGDMPNCCDVVETVFFPSSSMTFSVCLCQADFWNQTVNYFETFGMDAEAVMTSCVNDFNKRILYRGGPLSWC